MGSRIKFFLDSLQQHLWVKPLGYAVGAGILVFSARWVDATALMDVVPKIGREVVLTLLSIIAASMLGVATFAVASMVSAYASAGSGATPRAVSLLMKDQSSQNALSSFVGAFIFSIVGIVAIRTAHYEAPALFVLFVLTLAVLGWIVLTFVRWVDSIARLGRMGNTVARVEEATQAALAAWGPTRSLGGSAVTSTESPGEPIYARDVGYVQHVDMDRLQRCAEALGITVTVASPAGTFVTPSRPLLHVAWQEPKPADCNEMQFVKAFTLADERTFVQDPRMGLIVLSEIASRALSPAVNDPGTAIGIIGRLVKIFCTWHGDVLAEPEVTSCRYDRVGVPPLSLADLFDDAFGAIARDGAASVEIGIKMQKSMAAMAALPHEGIARAAQTQARLALERAMLALEFPHDRQRVKDAARAGPLPPQGAMDA